MEKRIIQLISLGKNLNSLIDRGETFEIKDLYKALENKKLFQRLKQRFNTQIDMDIFAKKDTREIEKQFLMYSISFQPEELQVESNGLSLLIAYCFMSIEASL